MNFRKEEEENYGLDLTPLIDVVFLLLIFFMVSTVFVDFTRRMDISLPKSKSSEMDETPRVIEIEMTKAGKIFLNGEATTLAGLENHFKEPSRNDKDSSLIRADKDLPYGKVVEVMGILQGANIRDISVAVK